MEKNAEQTSTEWKYLLQNDVLGYRRAILPLRYLIQHLAPYNPRRAIQKGERTFEEIRNSLDTFGLVEDIVFNERSQNVVGGNQRVRVMYEEDPDGEAPCVVIDCNENDEKMLCIALNRLHNRFDDKALCEIFTQLQESNYPNIEVTGFDETEIGALNRLFEQAAPVEESGPVFIICPKCQYKGPKADFETDETVPSEEPACEDVPDEDGGNEWGDVT